MEGKLPICSVIMPVYNTCEEYLKEAIESILGQTLRDFEFLIVDDGSDAYVRSIIDSYNDERICYRRLEAQSGAAAARNHALDAARGEFIAFMDSDDVSLPERLQKQVDYLRAHPSIGCLGTAYRFIRDSKLGSAPECPEGHAAIESYLLFCGCAFCQSSVMLRRSVLENPLLRYSSEYVPAEDAALWYKLIGRTEFDIMPERLVHYRTHAQSISRCKFSEQINKLAEAQGLALEAFGGFRFSSPEMWRRFFLGESLTAGEYAELSDRLAQVLDKLFSACGFSPDAVLPALRARVRKTFYHTRSLRGQWTLLRSPLRKLAGLSLCWALFCLVTRGIL